MKKNLNKLKIINQIENIRKKIIQIGWMFLGWLIKNPRKKPH